MPRPLTPPAAAAASAGAVSLDGATGAQPAPSGGSEGGEEEKFDGVLALVPQHYEYISGLKVGGRLLFGA